jgi:hypothetical protein
MDASFLKNHKVVMKTLQSVACLLMMGVFLLGGCVSSSPETGAVVPSVATVTGYPPGVTPSRFRLPDGEGCSGEAARFRAVMGNDLATGHVTQGVHDKVVAEIAEAQTTCTAGNASAASAMIRTTKTRYGYP